MRGKSAASLCLQNRDFALLRGLFESRVMTAAHMAALYFDGKKEAAKKRLQSLKASGLVGERKRRVNEPSVLFLTRQSFALLNERSLLSEYPKLSAAVFEKRATVSDLTLRHELDVMDVKAAFHSALRASETFSIAEFSTWPRLHEFNATRPGSGGDEVLVKPDGFIRIHEKERGGGVFEHIFFLEVDRSTETQNTLVRRAACYLDYYRSGGFAARNGSPRASYKQFPFRLLIVLKTTQRRDNTARHLLHCDPPILTFGHLATLTDILTNPIDPIWVRPIDYRDIESTGTSGSPLTAKMNSQKDCLVGQIIPTVKLLS